MAKGNYLKPLQVAFEMSGYQLSRLSRDSHLVYQRVGSPNIVVPPRIEDPKLFYKLRKLIVELSP